MPAIEELREQVVFDENPDETVDMITQATVEEEIRETDIAEIEKDFVASTCAVLYGLPVRIRFMTDALGNPDFKSAWDSVIEEVSIDNQSLRSFIELARDNDNVNARGLQNTSATYNAFLILSGKIGSLRWAIFKLASSLQVLNAALSLSVGAKITESIPNLHVGVLSMALMFQARSPITE